MKTIDPTIYRVEILERRRILKGLTYLDLAKKLHMSWDTIAYTLRGKRKNLKTIVSIAKYLNVPMEEVVVFRDLDGIKRSQ